LLIAALALLVLSLAGCGDSATTTNEPPAGGPEDSANSVSSSAGEPLVIGDVQGLTGEAGPGEVPASEALKMVVEELNAAGGIAGHPIKLIVKDMKSDPTLAGPVTEEVLAEGAQIIVGPAFPGIAAGVVQAAAAKDVPVICLTATTPGVTTVGGAKAYMVAFGDNAQAAAAAEYAAKQNAKTAYVLGSPDSEYTSGLAKYFEDAFTQAGGTIIGTDTFSIGQQDFGPQVTKIANLDPKPDVIYTTMMVPDTGVFMKQLRGAGVDTLTLGTDGDDNQVLIDFGGEGVENMVFTTHGYPEAGSANEAFQQRLTTYLGKPSDGPALASLAADLMAVVSTAVEKAGSLDPQALAQAIDETENVQGINGTITLKGTSGVPLKPVYIVGVEGGKFVLKDKITPSYVPSVGQ
jgi:branched-chain amino acid transport system substrate-binding protein